jgi:hypothetical protein
MAAAPGDGLSPDTENLVYFNSIDAETGEYAVKPQTVDERGETEMRSFGLPPGGRLREARSSRVGVIFHERARRVEDARGGPLRGCTARIGTWLRAPPNLRILRASRTVRASKGPLSMQQMMAERCTCHPLGSLRDLAHVASRTRRTGPSVVRCIARGEILATRRGTLLPVPR